MARTIRIDGTRDGRTWDTWRRRSYYSTERKWARKATNRQVRNRSRQVVAIAEDHDDVVYPEPVHTGGWISH